MTEPLRLRSSPGRRLRTSRGIGALTISAGGCAEVCDRAVRQTSEALVLHRGWAGRRRGDDPLELMTTYGERANAVARALIACGHREGYAGRGADDEPAGIPVSGVRYRALAGGVAATLSTFSTQAELDHLLRKASSLFGAAARTHACSSKDFVEMLIGALEPEITDRDAWYAMASLRSIRSCATSYRSVTAAATAAVVPWRRGMRSSGAAMACDRSGDWSTATAATVTPGRSGRAVLLVGIDRQAQGHPLGAPRPALQLWRWKRNYLAARPDARAWSANGFFWSGNFCHGDRRRADRAGGSLVLQAMVQRRGRARADGGASGRRWRSPGRTSGRNWKGLRTGPTSTCRR